MDCIFCKIIAKKEKAYVVYEDKYTIAILDKNPFTEGHTVIMPKKHYSTIFDVSEEDLERVIVLAQKLIKFYKKEFHCEGSQHTSCIRRFCRPECASFSHSSGSKVQNRQLQKLMVQGEKPVYKQFPCIRKDYYFKILQGTGQQRQ